MSLNYSTRLTTFNVLLYKVLLNTSKKIVSMASIHNEVCLQNFTVNISSKSKMD